MLLALYLLVSVPPILLDFERPPHLHLPQRVRQFFIGCPWSPSEIYRWIFSWLHILAYGQEAMTRKYQGFYGERDAVAAWVLQHDDLDEFVETQLDENDRRRHRPI